MTVPSLPLIVIACGVAVGFGLWLTVMGLSRRPARLSDALDRLDHTPTASADVTLPQGSMGDRLGWFVLNRSPMALSDRTRRLLQLKRRTAADFAAEKGAFALIGLSAPLLYLVICLALGLSVGPLPAGLALVSAVIGWFVPDLTLARSAPAVRSDAGEALCTFVDLVTLERLANQSSTQSLANAAAVSDHPLFVALRTHLDRARLEQRPAWQALREVGDELELPQLSELGDVMRLDEHGAALGAVLRARSEELRDAHLMTEKMAAQQVSESMTIWMVVPAMVFGLVFLVPPLLTMLSN